MSIRTTVVIDDDVATEGRRAVELGASVSFSRWVNERCRAGMDHGAAARIREMAGRYAGVVD